MPDILKSIEESLRRAYSALWEGFNDARSFKITTEDNETIRYYLDRAFLQTLFFLEAQGLPHMLSYLEGLYQKAKPDLCQYGLTPDAEPYLTWVEELRQFLSAIEGTLGEPGSTAVSKDVIEILKNCQYAITAPCFLEPPKNEQQVNERIEAVLKCVFPDLRRKPPIGKPIKNFVPDTGLPSVRTLIEYKFISSSEDAKRVAEEVLADTRGYVSKEWDTFVYVIYETHRIEPEFKWNQLMRASGLGESTKVIVISGEPASEGQQVGVPGKSQLSG